MSEVIKRFNKETGQWEVVAAGNANNIITTDPRLLDPEEVANGKVEENINEVLVKYKEKLAEHDGHIAWLAEHGGGGSGGGGGTTDAKVTITNGDIVIEGNTKYLYSSVTTNIKLNYLIESSKNNKRYFINVSLDGSSIIKDQEAWTNTPGTLIIPKLDQFLNNSTHSVVITATDTDGFAAESYLLNIVEASIKLASSVAGSTATVGIDYFITYTVTSKIIGSAASLVVTNITNGFSKSIDLGVTTSTTPRQINVNLWELGNIIAGSSYTIQAQAFTDMSGSTVQSDVVTNRTVVEDGINLVVLVEGITSKAEVDEGVEKTKFSQGGNISFAFTPYLAGVSLIYYAVRLEHNGTVRDIGYFDTGNYNDNQYVQRGKQQVFSWAIPTEGDILGDWNITLRCWSEKGDPITDVELICQVVASSQSLIPDQNPNDSMYAAWHIRQESFPQIPTARQWTSSVPKFTPPGSLEPVGAVTNLEVYNTNGALSGFLTQDGQSMLRISGEAYGIIDVQPFKDNATELTNWSRQGFSMSVTFKTDVHPFTNRTVFFCGDYNTDEEFSEGIKIGLEDITWSYTDGNIKETINCKVQQNVINTVDFIVNKNPDKRVVGIFVNGTLNVAREIKTDFTWKSSSKIYLGCDISNAGRIQNYSDVNFYDIKLFRSPLNDKEIVINYMNANARAKLLEDGSIDFVAYNSAKLRNFFSTSDNSAHSTLWDDINQTYATVNFNSLISDTTRTLPVDIMLINCANTGFTRAVFEEIGGQNNNWYTGCTMSYFSPTSGKSSAESTTDVAVSKQGTSTMNNLIKNLEIRFDKMLKADDGSNLDYELFQPKETWFPERQFTLKADVVDSAHANNASIGKWINDNADILFEKTPPMEELEARRPTDTRDKTKVHEKVTIKQTLEGFPCILLIQFDGEETQTCLGIYSFNLGRGAYYNMGFRFLKDFTTKIKNSTGEYVDNALPAFVTSYHAYGQNEKFGSIDQQKVYSYEIGENANVIVDGNKTLPLALFMQDDISIIKHVGEFKYNGGNWLDPTASVTDDAVWTALQELFTLFAQMTSSTVKKYTWNEQSGGYVETEGEYPAQSSWSTLAAELDTKFSIKNAYSYFLVCVKFGLVDSLGKNMTIVCYDIGGTKKWYIRFYDMDTANGLDNTALESVAKTAYLDTFSNNPNTDVNSLVTTRNSLDGGYDTYSSRMWDVLRDSIFINTGIFDSSLEELWDLWRNNANISKDVNHYIDEYFSAQTKSCGELLFNYDYNVKYLTAYVSEAGGSASYANIEFLHGTRVEYVRDWLKKRWWFFDGVFRYNNVSNLQPYNTKGTFSAGGAEATNPRFTITSNVPMIFVINIGNTTDTRYFLQEGVPTLIKLAPISSFNTQITINNTPQINDIKGLKEMRFQRFTSTMKLPSFSQLDLSDADTLSNAPVPFETVFVNDEDFSDVRHINLSNTKFWSGSSEVGTFTVNIEKYTKLKDLDISNSIVTSMSLPNASLASLNITNSSIEIINLVNQPFLDSIDFSGCKRLKSVTIDSCEKITELNLSNLGDLHTINITNCPNLVAITCTNNVNLTTFNVSNCNKVKTINISKCTNSGLDIYIVGAPNIEELNISGTNTTKPIQAAAELPKLTKLIMNNTNISSIQYGNKAIPKYNNNPIFDVTNLRLSTFTVTSAAGVHYFKFDNNPDAPVSIGSSFFVGCTSLKRVFGHIKLTGTNTFSECNNFYIHEPPALVNGKTPMYANQYYGSKTNTTEGKTEWEANTNLGTNITIGTTNMSNMFKGTNCKLFDAYYILYKCNNVTLLTNCFYGAKIQLSIVDSFNRNMFINCGKVTNMDTIFYGISGGTCIFYTCTRNNNGEITNRNGLLSPLVNLVSMSQAFYFNGNKYTDDFIFARPVGNVEWKITHFYLVFSGVLCFITDASREWTTEPTTSDFSAAKASRLLINIPNLDYINGMFNGSNINFDLVENDDEKKTKYCPLFYNNTKLRYITNSFNNLNYSTGSLLNVFGGQIEGKTDKFSSVFYAIQGAFNAASNSTIEFPIHNSMFRRIKTRLKYITGTSATNATTNPCFTGFTKTFLKEDTEVFPYEVFSGCSALVEAPGFFSNIKCPTGTVIELPKDIFKDCVNLTNISYEFYNMENVKYSFTGEGFKNCKIVNAAYCFAETNVKFAKTGMIPYKLFYQEQLVSSTIKGWKEADAATDNITPNFGIDSDGNWIPDEELPTAMPKERSYSIVRTTRRKSITNMAYCLQYFQATDSAPYTMNYGSLKSNDYGDLLIPNEQYNPVKYIVNPNYNPNEFIDEEQTIPNPSRDIRRIIDNPNYNKYELIWNVYAYDGLTGLYDMISNSELYAAVTAGTISVSPDIPQEFNDPADAISAPASEATNRKIMNYFCPPDLFASCSNTTGVNVVGVFYYSGRSNGDPSYDYMNYGLRGRPCPYLFKPISNVQNISYMFYMMPLLAPYKWNNTTTNEEGLAYSTEFFANIPKLVTMSYAFVFTIIPSKVVIDQSTFINNLNLQNIDHAWLECQFLGTTAETQVHENTFSRNTNLRNISYCFASTTNSGGWSGRSPKKISSNLFTANKHKNITNCSGVFYAATATVGSVPEFWTWLNALSSNNRANVFYRMVKANLTNGASIPATWNNGMT